ncbi:MAG: hypothetical protein B7Z81_03685 [Acidocella sp. 20-61-6]|nr:MAG: hypothetical protein B7Z81_03685 [Acidocella sp. 20-61-6]
MAPDVFIVLFAFYNKKTLKNAVQIIMIFIRNDFYSFITASRITLRLCDLSLQSPRFVNNGYV